MENTTSHVLQFVGDYDRYFIFEARMIRIVVFIITAYGASLILRNFTFSQAVSIYVTLLGLAMMISYHTKGGE
jgi:hypothetical protein